ncbi:MAG: hypothetical protein PVH77_09780 [Phycisphaerales bacterium]
MTVRNCIWFILISLVIFLFFGCQINQRAAEVRTDEQMLNVSFENRRAEDLFDTIIRKTERANRQIARVGVPLLSVYSRYERVAFNAHCNDHITKMDTDGDLFITEQEVKAYYKSIKHLIKDEE